MDQNQPKRKRKRETAAGCIISSTDKMAMAFKSLRNSAKNGRAANLDESATKTTGVMV